MNDSKQTEPFRVCIVGAGPAGLYLAHLLLKQQEEQRNATTNNNAMQIDILERAPKNGTPDGNAFGFGVGSRHKEFLNEIPGLWERIEAKSAPVTKLRIIGRNNLCRELLETLEETAPNGDDKNNCNVLYETSCESIDIYQKVVTTTSGKRIPYDVLVGSDGVNSMVRKLLVETRGLVEERYLRNVYWKSLQLPQQEPSVLSPTDFKRLTHPSFKGAVFPRYPEGHTALVFWDDSHPNNPRGIKTSEDLQHAMTKAIQPSASKWEIAANLLFSPFNKKKKPHSPEESIRVAFDDKDCQRFVESKARRENYLNLDRYHDTYSRIALVGDSAHGMYSLLGQGAACGFLTAKLLANSLKEISRDEIPKALELYSSKAVPEGHAIVDLNLLPHGIFGRFAAKLLSVPLILWSALRGKLLMNRLNENGVTYQQIYKENSLLVKVCRYFWKQERRLPPKTKVA